MVGHQILLVILNTRTNEKKPQYFLCTELYGSLTSIANNQENACQPTKKWITTASQSYAVLDS